MSYLVKIKVINCKKALAFIMTFMFFSILFSQEDTIKKYELYKKNVVLYSDLGYNSAPFSIKTDYPSTIEKLKYRNNYKNILGFGICYKWFALRLSFALGQNAKPISKFGKSNYLDLGFNFQIKRYYWDVNIRSFNGYVIKDAFEWDKSLTPETPNKIQLNTKSIGISINAWYFLNDQFKMQAVMGKTGHFIKEVKTWYIKNTFNIYGVSNGSESIIPTEMIDINNSKTASTTFSAIDFGLIPGYAYANRKNNWQVSTLLGLGAVLQNKYYNVNGVSRGFLGLAPRYDVKLVAGYSAPKFFVFIVTDFDNKSIRFNDLVYKQSFYSIKLVAGIRIHKDD